ncbi:LLM class flavin-dependent oxidoreductase [Lichenihabitans sp. Uapishka_5]|uniref:LLM class flavin-dependent oxidoreductase n=1 Tax=Lichenihabitans sp. Uapishka_5 TaxID=3037302 RepID=UPI0029E7EA08|nr:LLM class flavin-dependent oxidoreductase [Lichenihabitans sp. Uapishka_5]MDX7952606.1 LLM class flavin-dependent oxidoreductase [Lichenihabitans sp. Uapishka_5]
MPKPIILNAFSMNTPSHLSPGLWRHPRDKGTAYTKLSTWIELAQLLERGGFSALFLADSLGAYESFGGSPESTYRHGLHAPINDPFLLVPAMAAATRHLAFAVTASVSYEHPFALARRFSTLDHLTEGRIGWNIVTSALDSAARNFGRPAQLDHDARYDRAEEYLQVCYKLWEGSWDDDAVRRDKASGLYADPSRIRAIDHHGDYFDVAGPHLCEPSRQRSPVLYQAGASQRGRAFAATHAECIFVGAPSKPALSRTVKNLRAALAAAGRDPASVPIIAEHTVITAPTAGQAEAKRLDYQRYASPEGALTLMSGWIGVDLSRYSLDDPFEHVESNAIRSAVDAMSANDPGRVWTIGEIAAYLGIGGLSPATSGPPEGVADALEGWIADTGIDGFNLSYAVLDDSFRDFVDLVAPVLARRGLHPGYEPGSFRQKLFGRGDRLPTSHPAAAFRHGAQPALGLA